MNKIETVVQRGTRRGVGIVCALTLILIPFAVPVLAQESGPADPEASQPAPLMAPAQLDNLVAPIALYPDALLTQVLVASTYPLEIVEANQWLQQNGSLPGQQRVDAARQQSWDASVQALVAFPDVLGRLASNVGWTSDLGNAFLAQQSDVMAAVQRMRAQAQAAGRLGSDSEQTVTTQTENGQSAIEIAPANPQVIYVPQYNPEYVWGEPAWGGYYPALYYPQVSFGFGFGPGIFLGSYFGGWSGWGVGGWGGWGWGPNWFNYTVVQNRYFFNHYGFRNYRFGRGGLWAHNPIHRMGVPYTNRGLATRFHGSFVGRGAVGMGRPNVGVQRGAFNGSRFQGNSAGQWRHFGNTNANVGQRGAAIGGNRMQSPQVRGNAQSFRSPAGRAPSNFQSAPANRGNSFRSTPSFGGGNAARSAPAFRQSPNAGAGRSFNSARPSFGGNSHSVGASRPAFNGGGGGARSFGGGHSVGGGGGGGFHGGGAPHGGGGGSHGGGGGSHGGGGGSHGGGGHGRR